MVFPMAENTVVIPEYSGLLAAAPSPLAAERYLNWRITIAGGDAAAKYGFYSLIEGTQPPAGLPAYGTFDVLPDVPLPEFRDSWGQTIELMLSLFSE